MLAERRPQGSCVARGALSPGKSGNSSFELGKQWRQSLGEEWALTVSGRRTTSNWKYWQNLTRLYF